MSSTPTVKYLIAGREYRPESALRASLNIWRRVLLEQGVGLKTVLADLREVNTPLDVLDDPKVQKSFMVLVWVLRLAAGEDVTFEEANDVALDDFKIVVEDEEPAADPKAATASGPAASSAKPKTTSRTSKTRSTGTSSSSRTTGQA